MTKNKQTRRDFIKISGTAAAGLCLATNTIPLTKTVAGENGPVKHFFQTNFGIDKEMIDKVLALALSKGGDYADFFADYDIINSIRLEEKIIKSASKNISAGVGIRVLKGNQTGYAYVEDITAENLNQAAKTAANIANQPGKTSEINVNQTDDFKKYYPILKPLEEAGIDNKIKLMKEAEAHAFAQGSKISKVSVSWGDSQRHILIANSDGVMMEDYQPMMRFSVGVTAIDGDNYQYARQSGGGRIGMEYFNQKKSPVQIAQDAVDEALLLLKAEDAPAGPMPIVLAAGDSGILLHESIGHPLEADFNRKGTSAYAGRIGDKVASELCTIYDGGTIPNDRGSINFDDEGIQTEKTLLIEKGVLKGYMHDRISAQHYQVPQTGNGRRESYQYNPLPRMTVTYLENGQSTADEIIQSVKKGIYCKDFSGGQVDISNGDFVFNPTVAYMIEDGKMTYPVKNFTLIGNGPDVLTKVSMVGNDFKFSDGKWTCGKGQRVPVGVGLPTTLVSEITVGGSNV